MNIAICDDNAADSAEIRAYLKEHLEKNCFVSDIHIFESGEALIKAFYPGAFDAVFLDIYMGGMTGVETAHIIRRQDPYCVMVFITTSPDHMPEGFSLRAASYVVKPITRKSMDTAFLQCRNIFLKNARFIEVSTGNQNIRIPLTKIIYVEVLDKIAFFHTPVGTIKTYMPLDAIEKQMGGSPFLRCHRSYLVNMNYVTDIMEYDFLMHGGTKIPLRKNGRKQIKSAINLFLSERLFEEV